MKSLKPLAIAVTIAFVLLSLNHILEFASTVAQAWFAIKGFQWAYMSIKSTSATPSSPVEKEEAQQEVVGNFQVIQELTQKQKLPSSDLVFQRKNSRSRKQICDFSAPNPQSVDKDVLQQQHNIEAVCSEVGIVFRPEVVQEIAQEHPVEEVKSAISLFHRRAGHKKISNPSGWLISCLENGWWHYPGSLLYSGLFKSHCWTSGS